MVICFLSLSCRKISRKPLLVLLLFFLTYSQSSGTSGSLVSRLARLTLKEITGRLLTTYGNFNDMATNALFPILTYRRSLGSGEANVSRLASWSSWARGSGAAILSRGSLEDKTGKDNMKSCWQHLSVQI